MSTLTIYPSSDLTLGKAGSGTWASAHDAITASTTSADPCYAMARADSNFLVYRHFFNFDLSGLGAGATITAIEFGIYGEGKDSSVSRTYNIYDSTASTTIADVDFDQGGTTAYCDTAIAGSSFSTTGYNTFAANATAITAAQTALDGSLLFKSCVREVTKDVANVAPTDSGSAPYVQFSGAAHAETTQDPYILVTYTVVTTNIKSINGLAYASVKSVNGLAKASIKLINGLA